MKDAAFGNLGSKQSFALNPQPIPQRVPRHCKCQQGHAEGAATREGGDGEFGHGVELLFLAGDGFCNHAAGEARECDAVAGEASAGPDVGFDALDAR